MTDFSCRCTSSIGISLLIKLSKYESKQKPQGDESSTFLFCVGLILKLLTADRKKTGADGFLMWLLWNSRQV